MRHIPGIYLAENEKGRSIFTAEYIAVNDTIEICPLILIPEKEKSTIHNTVLPDYYFVWPGGGLVIALGFGSIYNHSELPNAEVVFDIDGKEIIIRCIKQINPGEEILIEYTGGTKDVDLWFEVIKE